MASASDARDGVVVDASEASRGTPEVAAASSVTLEAPLALLDLSTCPKKLGQGAILRCYGRFLHPSAKIREKYPNDHKDVAIQNLTSLRLEMKMVDRRTRLCVVMEHADFSVNLYASVHKVKLVQEGPANLRFVVAQPTQNALILEEAVAADADGNDQQLDTVAGMIQISQNMTDSAIDDDNEPAPENEPSSAADNSTPIFGSWGGGTIDPRAGTRESGPSLKSIDDTKYRDQTPLSLFLLFFPQYYIRDVIISSSNAADEGLHLTYGDFLRWLGLWFLFACFNTSNRDD